MDTTGRELNEIYDSWVTLGSNGEMEDGEGNSISSSVTLAVVSRSVNLRFNGQSDLPPFFLPNESNVIVRFIPDADFSHSENSGIKIEVDGSEHNTRSISGPYTIYQYKATIFVNVPAGYIKIKTTAAPSVDTTGLMEAIVQ